MKLTQISVFLENRSGRIAHVTRTLSAAKINLYALALAETKEYGILRLIVSDPDLAELTLKKEGLTCVKTPVLAIRLDPYPGSIAQVLDTLDKHKINIEYLYAVAEGMTAVVIRVSDIDAAVTALRKEKLTFITEKELRIPAL